MGEPSSYMTHRSQDGHERSRNIFTEQVEGDTPSNPLVKSSQSFSQDSDLIYGSSSQVDTSENRIVLSTPTSHLPENRKQRHPIPGRQVTPRQAPPPNTVMPITRKRRPPGLACPTPLLESLDHIPSLALHFSLLPHSLVPPVNDHKPVLELPPLHYV